MLQVIRKFSVEITQEELDRRPGGQISLSRVYPVVTIEEKDKDKILVGIVDDDGGMYWLPLQWLKVRDIEV
ncbi:hypothetical protein [Desulfosporosinus sp. FKA]|uniref:hypothetical protein n=1 Tax=Desulfosporosinus sp. FKA TaxID=1969834 RepID=UPI000B49D32C|nr:hypothetical protein [Desulfosporosinus sp. FKA]